MPPNDRIYLDNAATSWPKPAAVYEAVDRYMRDNGAPAGRSAYGQAVEVERLINDARKRFANLMGVADPKRIVFTCNGTDALNLAIHGLLRPGDHVVTTVCEHNSVLRPLRRLEDQADVAVTHLPCDARGIVDPAAFEAAVTGRTKLFISTHASNVTGAIQPVVEIGAIARSHGIRFLVDAAQSSGHIPVLATQLEANLIATPGHKGLLGPPGTGLLYVAPDVEQYLSATRQGGTGTASENDWQPETIPDKYESGSHNVPGIIGLAAALAYLTDRGMESLRQHERHLTAQLLDGLRSLDHVAIHGPQDAEHQVGVVSITMDGYDPREVATMLDTGYSIQVRSGFHCAPRMHASLGTHLGGGTVRFSIGAFTTSEQIDRAIQAVGEIANAAI